MALHSRDAVTVSAPVATRSRADCSSMEGHTTLSTSLVLERAVIVFPVAVKLQIREYKIIDGIILQETT